MHTESSPTPKPPGRLDLIKSKILSLPFFNNENRILQKEGWLETIGANDHIRRATTLRSTLLNARANKIRLHMETEDMESVAPDVIRDGHFIDPTAFIHFHEDLNHISGLQYNTTEAALTLQAFISENRYLDVQEANILDRIIEEDRNARAIVSDQVEKKPLSEHTVVKAAQKFGVTVGQRVMDTDLVTVIRTKLSDNPPTVQEYMAQRAQKRAQTNR